MTTSVSSTFRQCFNNVSPLVIKGTGAGLLALMCVFSCTVDPTKSQGLLRQRLQQRMQQRMQARSAGQSQQTRSQRSSRGSAGKSQPDESLRIAGLDVAVWRPHGSHGAAPLVVFSHGFHGRNTQTTFLMRSLADAGYVVVAPNHKDALGTPGGMSRADVSFGKPQQWDETVYKDRGNDVTSLLEALKTDKRFSNAIDWSKVSLCGHSLGGYTVMALCGAWPSWKLAGVKAVLALSPYAQPFTGSGVLSHLGVPIMYQSGTRDLGILPGLVKDGGAVAQTGSPCEFVEFDKAGHFAWTDLNKDKQQEQSISRYCVEFLNKYARDDKTAHPETLLPGVVDLQTK